METSRSGRLKTGRLERPWQLSATLLLLVAPWLLLCQRVATYWTLDAAYAFAWSVPVLAAFLILRRTQETPCELERAQSLPVASLPFLALFVTVRFLHEAAPDWSVLNWSLAAAAGGFTVTLLGSLVGASAVRAFAWPLLLLLTVVPWPQRFELAVAHVLMRGIAEAAAELLSLSGIPALASGHLIHLPAGVLGVDEACSGLRSLQSVIMAALFLGELNRLSARRRVGLFFAGLGIALVANLLRTTLLALLAGRFGLDAISRWHDPVGWAELIAVLFAEWFIAQRLSEEATPGRPAPLSFAPLPTLTGVLGIGILLASEVSVQLWYGSRSGPATPGWTVRWPGQTVALTRLNLPAHAQRLLLCDRAEGASWTDAKGLRWIAYTLEWAPSRTAPHIARMHRPESCLQANGAVLQEDLGLVPFVYGDNHLTFQHFTFLKGDVPMHVFYCLDDANSPGTATSTWAGVLHRARGGLRNLGQRSLEVALLGEHSPGDAARGFTDLLQSLIVPR